METGHKHPLAHYRPAQTTPMGACAIARMAWALPLSFARIANARRISGAALPVCAGPPGPAVHSKNQVRATREKPAGDPMIGSGAAGCPRNILDHSHNLRRFSSTLSL